MLASTTNAVSVASTPSRLRPLASLFTILFAPRRTFAYLTTTAPLFLAWIAGATAKDIRLALIYHQTGLGAVTSYTLGKSPDIKLTAAQAAYTSHTLANMLTIQLVATPVVWAAGLLAVAALLLPIDKLLFKNRRSYKQILSIVTYAQAPKIVYALLVSILLLSNAHSSQLRIDGLLGINAGLLVPWGSLQPFYRVVLGSIDIFAIWTVLLTAIGLSSERTGTGKCVGVIGSLWCLYVTLDAGLTALGAEVIKGFHSR
jgi:hypothetical protein